MAVEVTFRKMLIKPGLSCLQVTQCPECYAIIDVAIEGYPDSFSRWDHMEKMHGLRKSL